MAQTSASLLIAVLILNIYHHHSNTSIPQPIKRLAFGGIATILCMRAEIKDVWSGNKVDTVSTPKDGQGLFTKQPKDDVVEEIDLANNEGCKRKYSLPGDVITYIRWLMSRAGEQKQETVIKAEWVALGKVLDRLMFLIALSMCMIEIAFFLYSIRRL